MSYVWTGVPQLLAAALVTLEEINSVWFYNKRMANTTVLSISV